MKKLIFLVIVLILISCKKELKEDIMLTEIDNLTSLTDVENYIMLLDSKFSKENYRLEMIKDSTQLVHPFCIGDFDNNGYKDLFVVGKNKYDFIYSYAFMSFGKDSIKIFNFHEDDDLIPKVIRKNNQDLLAVKSGIRFQFSKDTLIYKYDGFVSYNENLKKYNIEKITFNGSSDKGDYDIIIDQNLDAKFKLTKGIYDTLYFYKADRKLSLKEYNELIELLNYTDFPNLKEEYFERSTSHSMCDLVITYNHGKTKHIFDKGMRNNYSLKTFYSKLEDLKKTVQLEPAGKGLLSYEVE